MSELETVRYPSGAKDFLLSDNAPKVGDVMTRRGNDWIVEEALETRQGITHVKLRPGAKPDGRPTE